MNIEDALRLLEVEDVISIKIVKEKYRELQKRYHPDVSKESNLNKLNEINEAYKYLINFLENFKFSINELKSHINEEEKLRRRFSNDWLSGKNFYEEK